MLFLKYKADFTVEEMVQMENELKFSVLGTKELSPDDYVFDVGCGNKVTSSFARKRKGKTDSRDEQRINYKTAAYIMPYEEVLKALQEYDNSFPKMNAIQFVRKLQETYEQSETAVIRRIKEVRRISKRAMVRVR
ncbi:hypothetical protein B5F10_02050 [Anaerotruncus colihominis]|uniref:Uncharacterized protein n=2 Tax=Anaerotruncus colihominis TaxID=169435 RepID=A0A1Y4MPU5_9FIRM|nr:hypothetical protein [Anaerotruncus colihominis]OUP70725.1 hypothetical protein B5F11_04570 [Anaerotruncus colihominis]OUP75939.1 hypothetical protein B5F10_02050 [Anaerotruncus colihominis]